MKLLKEQLICFLLLSKHHLCYSPHYFCQSRDFFALLLQSCHFFALVHKSDTFEYKIECEKAIFVPTERNSVSITINRYFCLQRILQMILVQSSIIKKKNSSLTTRGTAITDEIYIAEQIPFYASLIDAFHLPLL